MIPVTRSSLPPLEEFCAEIADLWESHWLTNMGEKHLALEEALKRYLGALQLTLFTNGHLALEAALAAFDFPAGGEVITTPFTFVSTTHAIARKGLTPVFCDVYPETYTMDPSKIEPLITDKTVAILPVHVYGNLCDVDAIREIADRHGLKVIYDAAHAFGVRKDGIPAACFGDAAMFSFHATKVFHTIEGGAVCYRDGALGQRLNDEKNFGIRGPEEVACTGGNAKMNEFQAAMGLCNLRHLEEEILKRKAAAERYRALLGGTEGLRLPMEQPGVESNYAYFPVVFEKPERDEVLRALEAEDIHARKYFYPLTNSFDCYKSLCTAGAEQTPVAAYAADHVICLPLYADLAEADVDRICEIILKLGRT